MERDGGVWASERIGVSAVTSNKGDVLALKEGNRLVRQQLARDIDNGVHTKRHCDDLLRPKGHIAEGEKFMASVNNGGGMDWRCDQDWRGSRILHR
jgi:hypothetical protein